MNTPPSPFQCRYNPQFPELLDALGISIAISTYQAGKVVFISAPNKEKLVQLPRSFKQAMGIAVSDKQMAVATKDEVLLLANDSLAAEHYPDNPGKYDALYLPRANYYTGQVDIHDLHFGRDGFIAVNTSFSCLSYINNRYSFEPFWKPHFIDKLASEDRCHLNGLALDSEGIPTYVTALGKGNTMFSWKGSIESGGILINIPENKIVAEELAMPHSPRLVGEKVYMLLSAEGKLVAWDSVSGTTEVIKEFGAFVRGMSIHGDYAFVGVSRLRKNSSAFKHLSIAANETLAGIKVLHLPTKAVVAELVYENSVEEIYDVQIVPWKRPGILNNLSDKHKRALVIPGKSFWAKTKE